MNAPLSEGIEIIFIIAKDCGFVQKKLDSVISFRAVIFGLVFSRFYAKIRDIILHGWRWRF